MNYALQSIKTAFVRSRADYWRTASVGAAVSQANKYGIRLRDDMPVDKLADLLAENDWYAKKDISNTPALAPPFDNAAQKIVDYVREDDSEALLSMDGPDESDEYDETEALKSEIMDRWIGAVGGPEWYRGPVAGRARMYGDALSSVLDAVFTERESERADKEKLWEISNNTFVDMDSGPMDYESDPDRVHVTLATPQSESAQAILQYIVPDVVEHFVAKNGEYGDAHRRSAYGVKGELIGLDRKIRKLYDAIWCGKVMEFEQPEEMLYDVIGSALLTIDLLRLNGQPEA